MWKLSNSGGIENASELKMSFASDAFIPITFTESRFSWLALRCRSNLIAPFSYPPAHNRSIYAKANCLFF